MLANTYGINLDLATGFDLTGATNIAIEVADISGTVRTLSAAVTGLATVGTIRRVTLADDFAEGVYQLQAVVDFGVNKRLRSEPVNLTVRGLQ